MNSKTVFYIRLFAIVLNIVVFLFWGAFFVEHLSYFTGSGDKPPLFVYFMQLYHFLFLAGLLLAMKWNYPGGLLTLISSFFFFNQAAGQNFPLFFLLSNIGTLIWFGIAYYNYKLSIKQKETNINATEQL